MPPSVDKKLQRLRAFQEKPNSPTTTFWPVHQLGEARNKFYGSVRLTTGEVEVLLFADDLMMMAE